MNYIDTTDGDAYDMPEQQIGILENDYIQIPSSSPYLYDVYGRYINLSGWCTTYVDPNNQECDGDFYSTIDEIRVRVEDGFGDVVVNLYTYWEETGVHNVRIYNNSEADVCARSDIIDVNNMDDVCVYPNTEGDISVTNESYIWGGEYSSGGSGGLQIWIYPPASCLSTWEWNVDICTSGENIESRSGTDGMLFISNFEDYFEVVITGQCGS